jgi:uncharacterized protein (TIGR02598 family)
MRQPPASNVSAGFSLVELALAMGIASFALIALLGLITVGYQTGGDAKDETLISGMAQYVWGELKGRDFDSLTSSIFYFDAQGSPLPGEEGAAYRCAASFQTVAGLPDVQSNLTMAQLAFEWPPAAASPQRMVVQTSIVQNE